MRDRKPIIQKKKPFLGQKLAIFSTKIELSAQVMNTLEKTGFEVICFGSSQAYTALERFIRSKPSFFTFKLVTEPDCDRSYRDLVDFHPDYLITYGYFIKLPKRFYMCAKKLAINFHPSLLPKYKGAYPYTKPIENGDEEYGISVHKLTDRFDYGDIVYQHKKKVGPLDTETSFINKLRVDTLASLKGVFRALECDLLLNLPNPDHNINAPIRRKKSIGSI